MEFLGDKPDWDGEFRVVDIKKALSPSGYPQIDYALNPYGGCEHGCIYCYATGYTHSEPDTWRVVRVRRNIAERLAKELPNVSGTIGIGTSTDPYQYAEKRFMLTRSCLEVLRNRGFRYKIHTKSDLVVRDIDILSDMKGTVSMTVTTLDDRISRMTEPGAPLPSARIDAVTKLVDAGIDTVVLIAPVMSTLNGHEEEMIRVLKGTGIKIATCDPLSLRYVDPTRLDRMGIHPSPESSSSLITWGKRLGLDVSDKF